MISTLVRTFVIYCVAIFAMRLMGKRQLGELQPAELVTTFLISNVAAICIDEPDLPLLASLAPIFLIAALEILNSTAAWYCPRYANLLFGKPVTVIQHGKILQSALSHLRMTPADLAETMRAKDVFSPQEVLWGVIEPNGSISIAKVPDKGEAPPMLPILIDGLIYHDNLSMLHLEEDWINETLRAAGLTAKQVLLLLYNGQQKLLVPKVQAKTDTTQNERKDANA